ncbi:hypothetical protein D9M71_70430 [compost metagenome]|nr:hypothetical protein PS843_03075 [Pseudomonas fluorescens]
MVVNGDACCLEKCVAFKFIASKLAPTEAFAKSPPDQRQLLTSLASATIANNSR